MDRSAVESRLIRSVGYDLAASILEVELVGGALYEYFDVPYSAFEELLEAESKGAYYNDLIKDFYAYRRLDPGTVEAGHEGEVEGGGETP
ncbi:MAG TPA: KTSC domain-containing protein [Isosphaeraceae bacterium]|jgi:hypothetical protein|nr:KTSC domain-containing protein [Isosphaeraceae bacterium]